MCVLVLASLAMGQDAAKIYQEIFGPKAAAVTASSDPAKTAAFARELLDSTAKLQEQPDVAAYLMEKAYEFGLKFPAGLAVSAEALDKLMKAQPARKAEFQEKMLGVRQLQYARCAGPERSAAGEMLMETFVDTAAAQLAANKPAEAVKTLIQAQQVAGSIKSPRLDEITELLKQARLVEDCQRRLAALRDRLQANPKDPKAANDLILFHLVELDQPSEAAKIVTTDVDAALKTNVPLAAKDPKDLSESDSLAVGDWYRQLALQNPAFKTSLLVRSRRAYERFLSLHTTQDAAAVKTRLALHDVKAEYMRAVGKLDKWPFNRTSAGLVKDEQTRLIQKNAINYLYSRQAEDGSFPDDMPHKTGKLTAMALYALLDSGQSVTDLRVARGLAWLVKNETSEIQARAFRCAAFSIAERQVPGQYRQVLTKEVGDLIGKVTTVRTNAAGTQFQSYWEGGNTCAVWGAAMGARAGVQVPPTYWQAALKSLLEAQTASGGWGNGPSYDPTIVSTLANLHATIICLSQTGVTESGAADHKAVKRAIAWMDKNSQIVSEISIRDADFLMYLGQAGVAVGSDKIGKLEWQKHGLDKFIKSLANGDGKPPEARLDGTGYGRSVECFGTNLCFLNQIPEELP